MTNIEDRKQQIALLKQAGSHVKTESWAALEAIAAAVGPVIAQTLDQYASSNLIFKNETYNRGEQPSFPLELFEGNTEGLITVWSQTLAGGLASNHISGYDDFRFTVDTLDSAVDTFIQNARDGRLNIVEMMIHRMVQEILVKREYLDWGSVLYALGNSRANATGLAQVYAGSTGGFKVDDLNTLITKTKRLRSSWVGGTPTSIPGRGLTHIVISPEIEGDIRKWSYNPQNTVTVPAGGANTAMPLPDGLREQILNNVGLTNFFGVNFIPLNEFGATQVYNGLFSQGYANVGTEPTFNPTSQEIVVGIDLSVPAFIRLSEVDSETGSTIEVQPDDQWVRRQEKIGFYAKTRSGRVVTDSKAVAGIIITR